MGLGNMMGADGMHKLTQSMGGVSTKPKKLKKIKNGDENNGESQQGNAASKAASMFQTP